MTSRIACNTANDFLNIQTSTSVPSLLPGWILWPSAHMNFILRAELTLWIFVCSCQNECISLLHLCHQHYQEKCFQIACQWKIWSHSGGYLLCHWQGIDHSCLLQGHRLLGHGTALQWLFLHDRISVLCMRSESTAFSSGSDAKQLCCAD